MLKNLSLKTLLTPENNPIIRGLTTLTGKLFPKSVLINQKRSPDVPPLLLCGKPVTKKFLSSRLANNHPGALFKQFLVGWYNKIITDYRELSHTFNSKLQYFADSFYDWMENFMEMDYDIVTQDKDTHDPDPGELSGKQLINNSPAMVPNKLKYPSTDAFRHLTGYFQKTLILFHHIFNSGPELQIPMLEIVNGEIIKPDKTILFQAGSKSSIFETVQHRKKFDLASGTLSENQFKRMYSFRVKWPEISIQHFS
jgi:hypothetical protein